ncbi:MAG: RelA/SpoT family protein [Candidatus Paceibacterota bacterium]
MTTDINEIYKIAPRLNDEDKALIQKAYDVAHKAHAGQMRKSGEPYFIHVFATAKNLASFGMDAKTIAAGFLHDTLEDTDLPEEELIAEFGEEIVKLVNGVTKLGKVKYQGHARHVESLRKFFMAMADDLRILIIKLADRLHNVQTLEHVREDKRKRIALETIEIHARLADRIGMNSLKGNLEDAAFPYAYPKEYAELQKILANVKSDNTKDLEMVTEELTKELINQKINIVEISRRSKYKYSLWNKLVKYNMDIEKIYDVVALRVIVNNIEDCYRTLGIVHSIWKPLPGRIKDYISTPKPNGYRSLHTTIFTGTGGVIEVQIRTPEMHAEAVYGIAAHFIYKETGGKNFTIKGSKDRKFEWLSQLQELHKTVDDPEKFLQHLQMDLFQDRIFVFTPKGDVVDLPKGSTIIDFAYAIHSDIGDHTQSALINNKNASLGTVLSNRDIIEIIVNPNTNPSSKWLEYAKTSIARKHINAHLKENSLLSKFRSFAKF